MAKSKENIFRTAVQRREQEQQQIEGVVTGRPNGLTPGGKVKKRGENATTLTLSCSMEDKLILKAYAASQSMSVSDLLHRWIKEHCDQ